MLLLDIFVINAYCSFQLNDNARFTATKCSFEYIQNGRAIVMETEKVTRSKNVEVGSELSPVSLKNVSVNECKFSNNDDKGSIMLRPKDTAALVHRDVNDVVEESNAKEEVMEL